DGGRIAETSDFVDLATGEAGTFSHEPVEQHTSTLIDPKTMVTIGGSSTTNGNPTAATFVRANGPNHPSGASLIYARKQHNATLLRDGRIVVVGGVGNLNLAARVRGNEVLQNAELWGCTTNADCDDGNDCTDDVCNLDGPVATNNTCSHPNTSSGTTCGR